MVRSVVRGGGRGVGRGRVGGQGKECSEVRGKECGEVHEKSGRIWKERQGIPGWKHEEYRPWWSER